MAKKFKVKGLSELKLRITNKTDEVRKGMASMLVSRAALIEYEAKRNAPVNLGHLRQNIHSEYKDGVASVSANADYSPFVEFGTGTKVEVPNGFESLANKLRGSKKGSFEEMKEDIEDWCRSKGIDKKYVYPIILKILRVGISPQPFLIPAYLKHREKYLKEVKKYIDEIRW